MQKIITWRLLISCITLLITSSAQAQKACSTDLRTRFSRESVREIIDSLNLNNTQIVALIADEDSIAQKLYELAAVKELIVAIKDPQLCEDFEQSINNDTRDEDRPRTQIVCGGATAIDLLSADVIIVTALDVDLDALTKRVIQLPDGVKLLTREQLEYDQSLHLEAIRTIALSAARGITMYEYVVKRPTVADLLNELYVGMTGFGISQEEADEVRKAGGDPTYGEIELSSAEKIFTELVPVGPDDVFYDLGCGIGKLALWIYLATPAKKSVGIELCGSRLEQAAKAKKLMEEKILPQRKAIMVADWGDKASRKTINVTCGNIVDANLGDATIIYMCATCYPDSLMQAMVDKFVTLKEGLRIVTLKELPSHPSIHLVGTPQRFPMTWSPERGSPVYIYEMRHPQLKDVLDRSYENIDNVKGIEGNKESVIKAGGTPMHDELTYESAQKLFKNILRIEAGDVFCDLGSGVGKLAMQAYLETPAKRVIGIELSQSRFELAEAAKKRMADALLEAPYNELWSKAWNNSDTKTLEFRNESMLSAALADANKIFVCTTCISSELMGEIVDFCKKLPVGARMVTLKKLQDCSNLQLIKTHTLTSSWSQDVSAYEYVVGHDSSSGVYKKTPKAPVVTKSVARTGKK